MHHGLNLASSLWTWFLKVYLRSTFHKPTLPLESHILRYEGPMLLLTVSAPSGWQHIVIFCLYLLVRWVMASTLLSTWLFCAAQQSPFMVFLLNGSKYAFDQPPSIILLSFWKPPWALSRSLQTGNYLETRVSSVRSVRVIDKKASSCIYLFFNHNRRTVLEFVTK